MKKAYSIRSSANRRQKRSVIKPLLVMVVIGIAGFAAYKFFGPTTAEKAAARLQFDSSVSQQEQAQITQAIKEQGIDFGTNVTVKATTSTSSEGLVLGAYLPVVEFYSTKQATTSEEISDQISALPNSIGDADELSGDQIALIPANLLSDKVKLLTLDDGYYLDSFTKGAVFRTVTFESENNTSLDLNIDLNNLPTQDEVLTVNTTGVTALTRVMMNRLRSVGDPKFFSAEIGEFMASADITHVSNEVSFKDNCTYHNALFCSPPEFIETLKDSGVNLVELTGNHNNDLGSVYNSESIELYHSLGWQTFGGGLNDEEAAKPAMFDQKGTKLAFLGYNYPDSPNGVAISGPTSAGANKWDIDKIKSDIESAKTQADFVFVHIQFWECYAYPDGYLEFPQCDGPIPNQEPVFKQVADLGADMVVGSSAHQPQTYEIYNDVPIYYGLGNTYFDQTHWPGTERGLILTHYFHDGKLIQTRITPTVFNKDFQTRKMTPQEADYLLNRLKNAR